MPPEIGAFPVDAPNLPTPDKSSLCDCAFDLLVRTIPSRPYRDDLDALPRDAVIDIDLIAQVRRWPATVDEFAQHLPGACRFEFAQGHVRAGQDRCARPVDSLTAPCSSVLPCELPARACSRLALVLADLLHVTDAPRPVAWSPLHRRDGDNIDLVIVVQIHERELEPAINDAASLPSVLRPSFRIGSGLHLGGMNCLIVEFGEPSADVRVVLDFVQKLRTGFRVVADRSHRRIRRRASAWTSSAGTRRTAPASISAARRSISRSQAASASASASPCKDSRSSSARRARSSADKSFARAESSSIRVDIAASACFGTVYSVPSSSAWGDV